MMPFFSCRDVSRFHNEDVQQSLASTSPKIISIGALLESLIQSCVTNVRETNASGIAESTARTLDIRAETRERSTVRSWSDRPLLEYLPRIESSACRRKLDDFAARASYRL